MLSLTISLQFVHLNVRGCANTYLVSLLNAGQQTKYLFGRGLATLRVSDARVIRIEVDHAAADDGSHRGTHH
jgi:hypothetical protein